MIYYCFLFVARGVRADMLQGVPMGLVMGSIPFLLQSKLTYTELGIFSIAGYPYALKLFWSPVVDACYSKHILSSFSACHACVRCVVSHSMRVCGGVCACACVCVRVRVRVWHYP